MANFTNRQRVFCREYLVDFNATRAAVAAGYRAKNARITACKLISTPHIKTEIERLMAERQKSIQITADEILAELTAIVRANAADFAEVTAREVLDKDGNPSLACRVETKPANKVDAAKFPALAGIRQYANGGIDIKLYNKLKALELLMKHMGMMSPKNGEGENVIRVEIADEIKEWAE